MTGSSDPYNQPPLRGDVDLWADDPVLRTHAGDTAVDALSRVGERFGSAELREAGCDARRHPPEAQLIDRGGRRLDEVRFHPAYHRLMQEGTAAGYVARPWAGAPRGHTHHAALVYLLSQVEPGICCPLTMSYAAVPVLDRDPDLAGIWRPRLLSDSYDGRVLPIARKTGATIGMAMTERQGGSDLRGTITRAVRADGGYLLTGHKWFCSAPMSDAFLTLAQGPGGLTCYLVPRWLPEGRNAIRIDRLKDKLGNHANASAEIRYEGALAYRLGEDGAGVRTIVEMVHHTRLDTAIAPAGLMRAALSEAYHWVTHRSAFQRRLIDQPLMRTVLADLVLDWEGATALAFHVARAFDDPDARAFSRIGVALAKFLNNKLCPAVVAEAMETLGGMGFVEDTPLPMLYREAPLNGIWEGAGNVIALDILRTLAKDRDAGPELQAELAAPRTGSGPYEAAFAGWRTRWKAGIEEADARRFAADTARLLTASVLLRQAPPNVAHAYAATRLKGGQDVYGTCAGLPVDALLARLGPRG